MDTQPPRSVLSPGLSSQCLVDSEGKGWLVDQGVSGQSQAS